MSLFQLQCQKHSNFHTCSKEKSKLISSTQASSPQPLQSLARIKKMARYEEGGMALWSLWWVQPTGEILEREPFSRTVTSSLAHLLREDLNGGRKSVPNQFLPLHNHAVDDESLSQQKPPVHKASLNLQAPGDLGYVDLSALLSSIIGATLAEGMRNRKLHRSLVKTANQNICRANRWRNDD